MVTTPTIRQIKLIDTEGAVISGVMIPMSHRLSVILDERTFELKEKHDAIRAKKVAIEINRFTREALDEADIVKAYTEAKAATELRKNGGGTDVTQERIIKVAEAGRDKWTKGKTTKKMIEELAGMFVDIQELQETMNVTLLTSLWYCLRSSSDRKVKLFESVDDLAERISTEQLYEVYTKGITEATITEDTLKNSPSPTASA